MKLSLPSIILPFFALLHATAAPNPIESELFPPDFLMAQRETLGLNETQIQELQATVHQVEPRFEWLKSQLEERTKTMLEALHQPKPDVGLTEDKLRAMLAQENEMKVLQIHLMLTLRNQLTAEQVEKARQLRQQQSPEAQAAGGSDPRQGLAERLQKKFEQLKTALDNRVFGGVPPEEVEKKVHEIQHFAEQGQPLEAERRLDLLLRQMGGGEGKAKP